MITINKKEKTLVELTEEEFIKNIFSVIEQYDDQIDEIIKDQKKFYKLYKNYLIEKNNPKTTLKFYLENNTKLFYKKTKKPSIGYKLGGNKSE